MRGRAAGFTLIELVMAMTGVALLAVICYGAFYVAVRAMERGELAVLTAQRLRVLTDVLSRQVKSAANYSARDSEDDIEYPYFVGAPLRMSFITASGQLGGGGLTRVSYSFQAEPAPRLLIEEEALFSSEMLGEAVEDEQPMRHSAVLLENFETASFSYLAFDDMEPNQQNWCPFWDPLGGDSRCPDDMADTEGQLPRAVRIVLTGVPGVEGGVWAQDVPLMVLTFGGENGVSPDF